MLAGLVAACGDSSGGPPPAGSATRGPVPWQRTEDRAPCDDFETLRRPLFGDLHVHTRYSADAAIFGTRASPSDAYAFARGEPIAVADANEAPTRMVRIERPLDFAAVTDHAEFLGEVALCTNPASSIFEQEVCRLLRRADDPLDRFDVTVRWLFPAGVPNPPPSLPFCAELGVDCDGAAVTVWRDTIAAAEEAYDRSPACGFTAFIAYEHTASPLGRHRHRNVIFRNDHVPTVPSSQLETEADGFPQGLWKAIERDCLDAGTGCDAVIIPHNSNLSGGEQWMDPEDASDARRRQEREPLAEIFQQKGGSECRFDRLAGVGVDTADELCTFEQLLIPHELPGTPPPPIDGYPRRNLIRNTLKDGLALEQRLGVNPFQFGLIASTDTHDATGGNVDEARWEGAQGNEDATPGRRIAQKIRNNPGGLAAVWAEENSRDAIFAALRRRETYGTSGTRPLLRFFGGALDGVSCDDAALARQAYATGVPMGGVIGRVRGGSSPRFAVLAARDPAPGARGLDRLQIVKGWVDSGGAVHEAVFDVARAPGPPASVDLRTCEPLGRGADQLCAVWEDPDFDASERSFYYARLLESPTCRWSTIECQRAGVDPFSPECRAQAERAGSDFEACCTTEADDPFLERTIQERAWSSPIWYRPEALAAVRGAISRRDGSLALEVETGDLPAGLDPASAPLALRVDDGDPLYRLDLPPGALRQTGPGRFAARPAEAGASLELELAADGTAALRVRAEGLGLSRAEPVDHMVRVGLRLGAYEAEATRLWVRSDDGVATASESAAR